MRAHHYPPTRPVSPDLPPFLQRMTARCSASRFPSRSASFFRTQSEGSSGRDECDAYARRPGPVVSPTTGSTPLNQGAGDQAASAEELKWNRQRTSEVSLPASGIGVKPVLLSLRAWISAGTLCSPALIRQNPNGFRLCVFDSLSVGQAARIAWSRTKAGQASLFA
jgi:hypothetical protein